MQPEIDYISLWKKVVEQIHLGKMSVHGPDHWKRVERNGLLLAQRSGADVTVVRLFAVFHDSRRLNDGSDPDHGARGAMFARELRDVMFSVSDQQFSQLHYACTWHTHQTFHEDPTIGTCWDADRLDLGRVGMIPDSQYLNTAFAKEIADYGSMYPWRHMLPES